VAGGALGFGGQLAGGAASYAGRLLPGGDWERAQKWADAVQQKVSTAGGLYQGPETATGKAGACWLAKDAKNISLLDIYRAVDAPRAFSIHDYSEQKACFVSCHIKTALEKALAKTQKAMEASLAEISLAQIVSDVKRK